MHGRHRAGYEPKNGQLLNTVTPDGPLGAARPRIAWLGHVMWPARRSSHPVRHAPVPLGQGTGLAMQHHATVIQTRPPRASEPRRSARAPGGPRLRRLSDRTTLPGGGRRRRRVAVARGLGPGRGTFFGRFYIDPATGLQVGHETVLVPWRRGRNLVVWPPRVPRPAPVTQDRNGPVLVGARTDAGPSMEPCRSTT